jgi:adenosylhomocysteinase
MEGYRVLPMAEAAGEADLIVTATGGLAILGPEHFAALKDGVILCNSGHFDVEIDVRALSEVAVGGESLRDGVEEFLLPTGQRVYLLGQGRLVGQAVAEASPAAVMDMSFAAQALATEWLVRESAGLRPAVYELPAALDAEIARLKLAALGVRLDALSPRQVAYAASWREGT